MKHRKSLLLSSCGIAIGIVLLISGSIVSGMGIIFHWGGDNTAAGYEYTTVWYVGEGMMCAGLIILILGVLGVATAFIREYLDRKRKTIQSAPAPLQPS
jgi:hypothetical protein